MTDCPTPRPIWRILTWNVRGSHRPDVAALAEVIAASSPDAVALQEIRRGQARALATALGWRHVWARKHSPGTPLLWWLDEGHAIASPHALSRRTLRSLAPGTSTWTYRHRIVLAVTVARAADELRVYDTHLAAHRAPDERIAQARRVAALVQEERGARTPWTVVAGDLNADGELEVLRELRAAGLVDLGGGPTHPATAPRRRYDYVLVPDGSTMVDHHVPDGGDRWFELSDHLPVLLAFSPPDP